MSFFKVLIHKLIKVFSTLVGGKSKDYLQGDRKMAIYGHRKMFVGITSLK